MNKKYIVIALVAIIVVGAGGFYGGTRYESSHLTSAGQLRGTGGAGNFAGGGTGQGRRATGTGQGGPGGAGANGGFTTGNIIAADSNSITVQMRDGSSKTVYYSGSTAIGKTAAGSSSDLSNGEGVMITGTANSDGSITAQNIQIRPAQPNPAPGQSGQ